MNWSAPQYRQLVEAMLALETPAEAARFLRDLMTEPEIAEFAKRFEAAKMLSEKIPYVAIEKKTGLSSATVARVSRWLNGKGGGYRLVLDRMHHTRPS